MSRIQKITNESVFKSTEHFLCFFYFNDYIKMNSNEKKNINSSFIKHVKNYIWVPKRVGHFVIQVSQHRVQTDLIRDSDSILCGYKEFFFLFGLLVFISNHSGFFLCSFLFSFPIYNIYYLEDKVWRCIVMCIKTWLKNKGNHITKKNVPFWIR